MAKWQSQSYLWKYAIILCVIQGVTRVTSWSQLISNLLVAPACLQCCFWLAPHFFTPRCFCLVKYLQVTRKLSITRDHTQQPCEPHTRICNIAPELYISLCGYYLCLSFVHKFSLLCNHVFGIVITFEMEIFTLLKVNCNGKNHPTFLLDKKV